MFQSYALFPHMTVLENVAFGLRRRRIGDPVAKAHEALRLVELDHLAAPQAAQLSGGQQQRVALARAIVNRPALLLLDEPLGALDLKLRRQMQLELKTIQDEVGLTFLHVTHDQEEAMTMADTVAVMNKGRIEQMGAPGGALRAAAHGVRRQLPRPVEPVHRARRRAPRRRRSPSTSPASGSWSRESRAQRHAGDGHDRGAPREARPCTATRRTPTPDAT